MPPKYQPLSAEEKEAILKRHRELVDRMNENLPEEKQLHYDPDLEKRLDDPKLVGVYRIGVQMKEIRDKQNRIRDELEERFGKPRLGNPLTRSINLEMDVRDTPEAKAYNEKIYQDYLINPGKIVNLRYGKLINVNPKELYECGDDPLKLAEYYRDHYPQCEEAFNFISVIRNGESTPEMRAALASMTKPMETISYPVTTMKAATGIDFFACPQMNLETALMVQATCDPLIVEAGDSLKYSTIDMQNRVTMESPKSFFGKFVEKGFVFEDGMFVKHRPESYEIGEDGRPTNIKEVSYDRYFAPKPGEHIRIRPRRDNDLQQTQAMTRSCQEQYLTEWQRVFNQKRGYNGAFDLDQIEKQHQGGFFERRIRGSTSVEYKNFLQALKEYNDPNSSNYLNKDNLNEKGNAYLQHKKDQGYEKLEDMKGTSLIRSKLVIAAIGACNEVNQKQVENAWLNDYRQMEREPFLHEEDVQENVVDAQEPEKDLGAEKRVEIEDPNAGI